MLGIVGLPRGGFITVYYPICHTLCLTSQKQADGPYASSSCHHVLHPGTCRQQQCTGTGAQPADYMSSVWQSLFLVHT